MPIADVRPIRQLVASALNATTLEVIICHTITFLPGARFQTFKDAACEKNGNIFYLAATRKNSLPARQHGGGCVSNIHGQRTFFGREQLRYGPSLLSASSRQVKCVLAAVTEIGVQLLYLQSAGNANGQSFPRDLSSIPHRRTHITRLSWNSTGPTPTPKRTSSARHELDTHDDPSRLVR